MIHSMTAFARTQHQGDWGLLICEMRSINHRYLEISLHLPEVLRVMEMPIRECIRNTIKRGKIECTLRFQPGTDSISALFSVNTTLAQELCHASEQIGAFLKQPGAIHPTDILRFPGVLEQEEKDLSALEGIVLQAVEKTVKELVDSRNREGEELTQLFLQRLQTMQEELGKVRERLPEVMKDQQQRLLKRFSDAKIELDSNRLEQEMVIFAQKIDVAEEIDRTKTHIDEVRRVLKQGGIVGRRLDFLLQELNREANTMGSKSVDPVITHAAVEIKVLIEQIREQVQNIE